MADDQIVRYTGLCIIESIPVGERRTGENLYDELYYPLQAQGFHTPIELFRVASRDDLLGTLGRIAERAENSQYGPILHLETHGSPEGLATASGDSVPWIDLTPLLTRINCAMRLNLLVAFAMCHGAHFLGQLRIEDRAPLWGLIGPPEPVSPCEIEAAFIRFYLSLLRGQPGRFALEQLNGALVGSAWRFAFFDAAFAFRQVFKLYVAQCEDATWSQQRLLRNLARISQMTGRAIEEVAAHSATIRAFMDDHATHFERYRRHFFMCDLFPENHQRFAITLGEALGDPAAAV